MSPIKTLVSVHFKNSEAEIPDLFKNLPNEAFQWVLNPCIKNIKMQHLPISLQEQLINIREGENLLAKFQGKPLHN